MKSIYTLHDVHKHVIGSISTLVYLVLYVCDSWIEWVHSLMVGAVRTSCSGWTLQVLSPEDSACFSKGSDAHRDGPLTGRTSKETLLKWRSEVPRPLKKTEYGCFQRRVLYITIPKTPNLPSCTSQLAHVASFVEICSGLLPTIPVSLSVVNLFFSWQNIKT